MPNWSMVEKVGSRIFRTTGSTVEKAGTVKTVGVVKVDLGLPIQSALDAMGDFQVKEEGGVIYAWSDDRVFIWSQASGWEEARKL